MREHTSKSIIFETTYAKVSYGNTCLRLPALSGTWMSQKLQDSGGSRSSSTYSPRGEIQGELPRMRKLLCAFSQLEKAHRNSAAEDRTHTCRVCQTSFVDMQKLEMHVRRSHNKELDFCDKCNINIRCLETIEEHMKRHLAQPELVCSHCGVLFSKKDGLEKHIRSVMGETPYSCDQFDQAFGFA
jgi:hypothetical protein